MVRASRAVASETEEARRPLAAGAVACLTKDSEVDDIVGAIRDAAADASLSSATPRSSSTRPPTCRIRPRGTRTGGSSRSTVNFGDESLRDHVDITPDEFYRRLATTPVQPKTSQPTPADFARGSRSSPATSGSSASSSPGKLSGTVESARLAVQATRRGPRHRDRLGEHLGRHGHPRRRDPAAARPRHDRRGDRRPRRAVQARRAGSSSPWTRSTTSCAAAGSARRRGSPASSFR